MADTATAEPEAPAPAEAEAPSTPPADDTPAQEPGGLELHPTRSSASILVPARYGFAKEQVEAIRRTTAKDCNDAELVMFLEVAGRYEMDPFAGQIYAAKIDGRISIIISRDGLLAHANRQADFDGMLGDVVCENDEFAVLYDDGKRTVRHGYGGKDRGQILGAWAEVRREGREATYFFARWDEYNRGGKTPWSKQKSAMILKVAEAYALRKAFTVSGVVGEDEVARTGGKEATNLTSTPTTDYGDDELGERLKGLIDEANVVVPGSYRPAKVGSLLDGPVETRDERREKLANEVADFIAGAQEAAEAEGQIVDAEVVPDDA